ncbi:MAG: PEP-CTERM-box response regulator transcription factor [Sedimenticola sp.]|uniref:PEP-CTERM-box response regulator transcription factor n=1 Tax=Sedimenticola thiotaurini TaxID=1543721 RepID=A0A558D524_9GAMM|nr:PEP-CTERM-box response regulator transcription factor [Sedimenticola sp.]TVT56116.1 MAG: PEP-CTERM-box response regulator transcription factor [Sedimenticola thiotaurini]MCW8947411.1 PEP-CTERM-box response regulator transcription factor [Sedimenticola sp.]MCW8949194.1 PEP-CTERM-box response regulator transcription factor [Sedimenticola sp.]MCW8975101.1 PEP-CTERM-box response regulator transcription factor [Sedimenticola sp.]
MADLSKHLLIVEDDVGLQSQLRWCFDDFEVLIAGDRQEAITQLRRYQPPVVTLDLGLPPDPGGVTEGLATLEEILAIAPNTKVIVVTGDNDRSNAVRAIALGAYDFCQKPVEPEILSLIVNRAYHVYQLEQENLKLHQDQSKAPLNGIIATSPEMLKVCRTIEKVAPSNISTLLLGASGTGKELFAQALHELSPRADQKMVAINCAAIPANLIESELFGYEKGAFTGAAKQTKGRIEYANNGTLFLDEIGDLPFDLQAKLLRFLQERVLERIGGREEIPIDVRIICATHQNIQGLIEEGRFREDLYYRISEVTIKIPSLKDREGDALVLAKAFLERFRKEYGRQITGFDNRSIQAIENYEWPGNVREIESRIKRAVIMADNAMITLDDLELDFTEEDSMPLNLKQVRGEAERKAILRALNHSDSNISDTAKILGVTRPTLYSLMEKYDIKP